MKALFLLFADLSKDLQLLLALSLFFLALLLLPLNLELYFLLLTAHFVRAHLIEKFLLHAHLLLDLHHDQLLDHGLLVVRCELFSRLFSLSLGPDPLLALQFDCPKPVMVLVQQPTFQDLIRRLEDDKFWHLELEFRSSIGLLIGRDFLLSRDNLSNGAGFQCLVLGSADTAAQGKVALARVFRGWGMINAQRAVHSVAVPGLGSIPCVSTMATVAHVVRPEAVKHGNVAAEHTLPVDMLSAVLLADLLTSAHVL